MNKYFFIFLFVVIFISACGEKANAPLPASAVAPTSTVAPAPTQTDLPTVTPACISPAPTQADVDRALAYTGAIFNAADWQQSHEVGDSFATVTWQSNDLGGLVYLEARIKPCGYEEPDLNKEFNEASWQTTFANYESYESITECKSDKGVRLYQFKAQSFGFEYLINYWVQSDSPTRVMTLMVALPREQQALMGAYAAQLFPMLPNCS